MQSAGGHASVRSQGISRRE